MGLAAFNRMRLRMAEEMKPENIEAKEKEVKEEPVKVEVAEENTVEAPIAEEVKEETTVRRKRK